MSESHAGGFHRPVQKLVDSLIPFCRPPQGKKECTQIPPSAPKREDTLGCPLFLTQKEETESRARGAREGTSARPLPVAEKGRALVPQRSKNRRASVSPNGFSGTARWENPSFCAIKHPPDGGVFYCLIKLDCACSKSILGDVSSKGSALFILPIVVI